MDHCLVVYPFLPLQARHRYASLELHLELGEHDENIRTQGHVGEKSAEGIFGAEVEQIRPDGDYRVTGRTADDTYASISVHYPEDEAAWKEYTSTDMKLRVQLTYNGGFPEWVEDRSVEAARANFGERIRQEREKFGLEIDPEATLF